MLLLRSSAAGYPPAGRYETNPLPLLLILDLLMPGMDGFGLLEQVRRDERLASVRVIVLTAKDLTRAERDFLGGQGSVVVEKGVEASQALLDVLRATQQR